MLYVTCTIDVVVVVFLSKYQVRPVDDNDSLVTFSSPFRIIHYSPHLMDEDVEFVEAGSLGR